MFRKIFSLVLLVSLFDACLSTHLSNLNPTCGYNSTLTGAWQTINTPNYPENYPSSYNCVWNFVVVEATRVEIQVEGKIERCCDFLDVSQADHNLEFVSTLATISGDKPVAETFFYDVNDGYLTLKFDSDGSVQYQGYNVKVRAISDEYEGSSGVSAISLPVSDTATQIMPRQAVGMACGERLNLTASWRNFTTPNYPEMYPSNSRCQYTFYLSEPSKVELYLSTGETEECCDYVELTHLDSTTGVTTNIGRRSGLLNESEIITLHMKRGLLLFKFYSDSSVSMQGYAASVRTAPGYNETEMENRFSQPTATTATTATTGRPTSPESAPESEFTCGSQRDVNWNRFEFSTPGFPSYYPPNSNCKYSFNVTEPSHVQIYLEDGETEACCDYVKIEYYDALTGFRKELRRLRGRLYREESISVHVKHGFVDFTLVSDGSVQRRGLSAAIRIIPGYDEAQWEAMVPQGGSDLTTAGSTSPSTQVTQNRATSAQVTSTLATSPSTATTLPCGYVGVLPLDDWQNLTTPNYPNSYPSYSRCEWTFSVYEEVDVRLIVHSGATEGCCDYMRLYTIDYDESELSESQTIKGTVSEPREAVLNSVRLGTRVVVEFRSDSSINYRGYTASIKGFEIENFDYSASGSGSGSGSGDNDYDGDDLTTTENVTTRTMPTYTNGTTTEGYGYYTTAPTSTVNCNYTGSLSNEWYNITTPNYPNNYPNNANCEWKFYVPTYMKVELFVSEGETEPCCDFVEATQTNIDGVQESLGDRRGLLSKAELIELRLQPGWLTLHFKSDGSINKGGLRAGVRAVTSTQGVSVYPSAIPTSTFNPGNSTEIRCEVGVTITGNLPMNFGGSRTTVICPQGPSGRPACLQMQMESNVVNAMTGYNVDMQVSMGACLPDSSMCPAAGGCSGQIYEQLRRYGVGDAYNITRCEAACCTSGNCAPPSSVATTALPVTTGPSTNNSNGSDVTCAVGFEVSGNFPMPIPTQRQVVNCPRGRYGTRPACLMLEMDTKVMGVAMEMKLGQCIDSMEICPPSVECRNLILQELSNYGIDNMYEVERCKLTCCSSGNCHNSTTPSLPTSTSPAPPAVLEEKEETPFGSIFGSKKKVLNLFPDCTVREYVDDFIQCGSLFINSYPYTKMHECNSNGQQFLNCLNAKTKRCLRNADKVDLQKFLEQPGIQLIVGNLYYFRRAFNNSFVNFGNEVRTAIIEGLGTFTTLCYRQAIEDFKYDTERWFNYTYREIVWEDRAYTPAADQLKAFYKELIELVTAKTSKDFCSRWSDTKAAFNELYAEFRATVWPSLLRKVFRGRADHMKEEIGDALTEVVDIVNDLDFPKCLAFQEEENHKPEKKYLNIMFVVQGSGFGNSSEGNSSEFQRVRGLIYDIMQPVGLRMNSVGVTTYSKYLTNKAAKNQPYIKNDISMYEGIYSMYHLQERLQTVQSHAFENEENYLGSALKQVLLDDFKYAIRNPGSNKAIIIITNNKASDKLKLRKMSLLMKSIKNLYVFVIGSDEASYEELQSVVPNNNDLNSIIMTRELSSLPRESVKQISDSLLSLQLHYDDPYW